jgi:hypothetical protein
MDGEGRATKSLLDVTSSGMQNRVVRYWTYTFGENGKT